MKKQFVIAVAALLIAPAIGAQTGVTNPPTGPQEVQKQEKTKKTKKVSKKKRTKPLTPKERKEMERRLDVTEPPAATGDGVL